MNDSITNFLKRLTGITLSHTERLALRERLVAYTDMHPVAQVAPSSFVFGNFFSFIASRRFSSYALGLVLLIAAGGGVTLAAEGSVPGDTLYSIKIQVNEPVMTALAPTAQGQANVAANIATRRIDEAVTLASRGQLTPARQAYLSQQFDARITIARKKTDALVSSGDTAGANTVNANLAANLAGEAQALGAITTNDSAQSAGLLQTVVATSENISNEDENSAAGVTVDITATSSSSTSGEGNYATATDGTVGTTTIRTNISGRFSKYLHLNAASLRYASPTLNASGVLTPQTDLAIPHTQAGADESGTSDTGSIDLSH